jgi:hypothetical protein
MRSDNSRFVLISQRSKRRGGRCQFRQKYVANPSVRDCKNWQSATGGLGVVENKNCAIKGREKNVLPATLALWNTTYDTRNIKCLF